MSRHQRLPHRPPAGAGPAAGAAQLNAALALHQQGRLDQASRLYQALLRAQPRHFDALQLLATIAAQRQQFTDALALFDRALAIAPDHAATLSNRANALMGLQRHAEALDGYERALRRMPEQADTHNNRGNALRHLGRLAEALDCYARAVLLKPDYADAWFNRGVVLRELERPEQALQCHAQALLLMPAHADAHAQRSAALNDLKRPQEALRSCAQALRLAPGHVDALNQRGNAWIDLQRPQDALNSYAQAARIAPGHADSHYNCGIALSALLRPAEALPSYERALRLMSGHADAHWNSALCRLLMGDFARGWAQYEWRWKRAPGLHALKLLPAPLWLGQQDVRHARILLHAEQGLGDTLQFCRYARHVAALGATVLLEVPAPLKSLLSGLAGVSLVLGAGERVPQVDHHCPLMSLPLVFQTELASIDNAPYLRCDPAKRAEWQATLPKNHRKRIGLAWRGSPDHANDAQRSIALDAFQRVARDGHDHLAFHCLQKDLTEAERAMWQHLPGGHGLGAALDDFSDTAALLELMDLVITVDTSVAHLAGALGKPVWILLPFNPDWRWLMARTDSPWYRSARLFRQPAIGDWASVLTEVGAALAALAQADAPQSTADAATLSEATALHQQGRLEQAAALYRALLQSQPQHFDALQFLATIALQQHQPADAVRLFDQALAIDARHANAQGNRGVALLELKRPAEALRSLDRALQLKPEHADAHNNRGNALRDLQRPLEALASYAQALRHHPGHADAHTNRGNALRDLKRLAEALDSYDQALLLRPSHADTHNNRGMVLRDLKRPAEALRSHEQALLCAPADARTHNRCGIALREMKQPAQALVHFERALQLEPDLADAHNSRGNALRDLNRPLAALRSYDQAVRHDPGQADAHSNRGNALCDLRRHADALDSYAQALRRAPEHADAHWNAGLCHLAMGDFARGWPQYEWRWKRPPGIDAVRRLPQALWLGKETLAQRSIFLYGEQGLGDTLQFCRYACQVAALGADVMLEVPAPLTTLLSGLAGVRLVLSAGERVPAADYHAPLMSLPLAFRIDLDSISGAPYLRADPRQCAQWRTRLPPNGRRQIGLAWRGNPDHANDANRSLAPAAFERLASARVDLICLQQELSEGERLALQALPGWQFFGDDLHDFSDTAALLERMDLVITVDTSVAHLAGALGKPVWILLPFNADWRWLLGRSDSPWYRSARLFRQPAIGDWASVLDEVAAALRALPEAEAHAESHAESHAKSHAEAPAELPATAAAPPPAADGADRLRAAMALHQQGRLAQAKVHYEALLQSQPEQLEALHLLATIALQQKRAAEAVAMFDQVLAIDPRHADAHNHRGAALSDLHRPAEALASFDRALLIAPDHAGAHDNRGSALRDLKRLAEALASYEQALLLRPSHADTHNNRGITLSDLKRPAAALASHEQALLIDPEHAGAHHQRGNALRDLQRPLEALDSYEQALRLAPGLADAHSNRGNALRDLQRPLEALASYDQALRLDPCHAGFHNNRGNLLRQLKRPLEALDSYARALRLAPDLASAHNHRGNALRDLQRPLEALASYEQALRLAPDDADAHSNHGIALCDLRRPADALRSYAAALRLDPAHADAQGNASLCRLAMGDFAAGWQAYEWRWQQAPGIAALRSFAQPLWLGRQALRQRTILLHSEQGLGDTLQFCRYARQVAALGATVLLEVPPSLTTLLAGLDGVSRIVCQGEPLPDFDYHCPLMSLPLAFHTDLDTISAAPYLRAEAHRRAHWQARLPPGHRPRIGLAWRGNPNHANDARRSIALEAFKGVLPAHIEVHCLQTELCAAEQALLEQLPHCQFHGAALLDFSDTAALIALLDLVITVDTSVAHLAGAMGKPVWILLPFHADWRWLLERGDSPWYGSARLFRQPASGDWASVLADVGAALQAAWPTPLADGATLSRALALHRQGLLEPAEELYKELLAAQPAHFDALQLLAAIASQRHQFADAIDLFDQALAINPLHAGTHNNRGNALRGLQRFAEALASYEQAVRLKPEHAEFHHNQGNVLLDLKRLAPALRSYEQALLLRPGHADSHHQRGLVLRELQRPIEALHSHEQALLCEPDHAEAHNSCGIALRELQRPAHALECFERALLLEPEQANLHNNRGNALRDLDRPLDALHSYEQALRLEPAHADAYSNRGNALCALQRPAEALDSYARALRLKPDQADFHNNHGNALRALRRPLDALDSYDQALRLAPDLADAHSNRGNALRDLQRPLDALGSYEQALRLAPQHTGFHSNRGNALGDLHRPLDALRSYARALRRDPGAVDAHWNESLCRLLIGDFARGWPKYEWRWKTAAFAYAVRAFPQALWLGETDLRHRTILLHSEQGFGDTLQFCRYARDVAARGARVIVEVQAPLKRLLSGLAGASRVLSRGEPLPAFDCHCPLLSLPLALHADLNSIDDAPYLRSDPQRRAQWQARLARRHRPRIGLVWGGSAHHPNDAHRSIALGAFKRLVNEKMDFYCLQKELSAADRAMLQQLPQLAFFGDALSDFSDTAALVDLMDLVITVDTSVAHLAGAMGKPVWILLPFNPDWRWLLERGDSPWYGSARLFRQPAIGDWASVLADVGAALSAAVFTDPVEARRATHL